MESAWTWIIQIGLLLVVIWFVAVQSKRTQKAVSVPETGQKESKQELARLAKLRAQSLSEPLSELTRPRCFADIIGQQEGIRALEAAICGPNPQHVLIYGPPGIGKTCAARLVLEEAKKRSDSPFTEEAQFVEMDATCIRFDERAIADPLIGSVHDPIYQGAGSLGGLGVPQPKAGAVTRAHCGVLFLDEIGELHPMQMNKLLKVLEDRRVRFESAYYSPDNTTIPAHIHDIFRNGLPADFRLIGATTRQPEEIPPALRSRCIELHFRMLTPSELTEVTMGAAKRAGSTISQGAAEQCAKYAHSGRDAVNIVQLSAGIAYNEGRKNITETDVLWVARTCNYTPSYLAKLDARPRVGRTSILAVTTGGPGLTMELECTATPAADGRGCLILNGIVEEEELEARGRKLRRKSTARGSVENVLCAVQRMTGFKLDQYEIRFNIPGGLPADGPSAGVAIAIVLYSVLINVPPLPLLSATGEVTIHGEVRAVGGVRDKIQAAIEAGAVRIIIPKANDEEEYHTLPAEVISVETVEQVYDAAFANPTQQTQEFGRQVAAAAAEKPQQAVEL
ncbi:MAG: S16 family serine protease [Clostridia bacterium]